jgi:hypothetical protein
VKMIQAFGEAKETQTSNECTTLLCFMYIAYVAVFCVVIEFHMWMYIIYFATRKQRLNMMPSFIPVLLTKHKCVWLMQ